MDDYALIERYVFEAWDLGLTGADVVEYVRSATQQPSSKIKTTIENLMRRMLN